MKKLGLLVTVFALVFAFNANAQEQSGAAITFKEKSIDFGDITQGQKVEHTFKLTKCGSAMFIMSNVGSTCGCTVPGGQRYPIAPAISSDIDVSSNCEGKLSEHYCVVRFYSNTT